MVRTAKIEKEVAELRACNLSMPAIAEKTGVSTMTVHRILKDDEIKNLVDQERSIFLQSLPNARQNIQGLVDNFPTLKDKQDRYLAYKSSEKMMEAVGIFPSHAPSVFIQQIYNTQNNVLVSPVMQGLLDQFARSLQHSGAEVEEEG